MLLLPRCARRCAHVTPCSDRSSSTTDGTHRPRAGAHGRGQQLRDQLEHQLQLDHQLSQLLKQLLPLHRGRLPRRPPRRPPRCRRYPSDCRPSSARPLLAMVCWAWVLAFLKLCDTGAQKTRPGVHPTPAHDDDHPHEDRLSARRGARRRVDNRPPRSGVARAVHRRRGPGPQGSGRRRRVFGGPSKRWCCKVSAARGCRGGCPHRRGARGGGRGRAQQQGRGARGPRWRRRAWVSQRLARCTPSKFLGQPGIGIWLIGITRDLPQHLHGGSRSGRGGGGEHLRAASRRTPATPLLPPRARGSSERAQDRIRDARAHTAAPASAAPHPATMAELDV